MPANVSLPRWAPRIPRQQIRQLYENDAHGILDEELVDEVAYGFYARCQSILEATDAVFGRIHCPVCQAIVLRAGDDHDQELVCAACGWRVTWGVYQETYRRKQLTGGGATSFFREYLERLPKARTPRERMLLIDWMIHQCHESVRLDDPQVRYARPAALNLIEGSMTQVIELLETLATQGSSEAMMRHRALWQERLLSGFGGREQWLAAHDKGDAKEPDEN